jgi:hypothetical protein
MNNSFYTLTKLQLGKALVRAGDRDMLSDEIYDYIMEHPDKSYYDAIIALCVESGNEPLTNFDEIVNCDMGEAEYDTYRELYENHGKIYAVKEYRTNNQQYSLKDCMFEIEKLALDYGWNEAGLCDCLHCERPTNPT